MTSNIKCGEKKQISSPFTGLSNRRTFLKKSGLTITVLLTGISVSGLLTSCDQIDSHPNIITIQTSFTNDYLIKADNGYLLIDTSYPQKYQEFLDKLGKKGIKKNQIKYLLLTHHHDDHSGFVAKLMQETDIRLIVHEKALQYITRGVASLAEKPLNVCTGAVFSVFSLFKKNSDHSYPPIVPGNRDIIIRETRSDFLRSIGIPGSILNTPGHTDDSISVVLDDGSAFVGDAAMDLLNFCLCDHRPIYYNNNQDIFTSWDSLKAAGAKVIFPAHGNPFSAEQLVTK